jgi:phosphohistidine swiveling domain-containing protein
LDEWNSFMEDHGYDGKDQLFVSSARYIDSPEILLAKLRHNIGYGIKDPAEMQQENLARRRDVMALHEARAKEAWFGYKPYALSSVQKRNALLDHLMWMRNAPKLHISRVVGIIHLALLKCEEELIQSGRLEQVGDIFHLDPEEVDTAMMIPLDTSLDLMEIVRPRKVVYERAVRSKLCPLLVDSRCRILRPDVKDQEPGTLVGSAVSPGVASGRVRIVNDPTDPMETGEVLVAVVTDPAWTPLFVGASAVILQIGGVLQHGALCAREYGKPAVSGIEVMAHLKTGMMVTVDGNTGIVHIIDDVEGEDDR